MPPVVPGPLRLSVGPRPAPDVLTDDGALAVQGEAVQVRVQLRLAATRGVLTAAVAPASLAGVPARARPRVERAATPAAGPHLRPLPSAVRRRRPGRRGRSVSAATRPDHGAVRSAPSCS